MIRPEDALALPYGEFANIELVPLSRDFGPLKPLTCSRQPTEGRKERSLVHHMSGSRGYSSCVDKGLGHVWEQKCALFLETAGFKVFDVPQFSHNYLMHVDFEVEANGQANGRSFWVDVKAPKCLRKASKSYSDPYATPQDAYVVLELMPNGSLFGSKADYLAFGCLDGSFLFADRERLAQKVQEIVNLKERAAWPECALLVPYVRSYEGRHTVMTYVPVKNIVETLVEINASSK